MKQRIEPPSVQSGGDIAHSLIKGAIGAVPFAGSALGEAFALLLVPPYHKRLHEFLDALALRIAEHDAKLEDVVAKEEFVSAVRIAAEGVLKTHDGIKRRMFVNVAASIGLGQTTVADEMQQVYLRIIDSLSPLHIKMLLLLCEPQRYLKAIGIDYEITSSTMVSDVVPLAFPGIRGRIQLQDRLLYELGGFGLGGDFGYGPEMRREFIDFVFPDGLPFP